MRRLLYIGLLLFFGLLFSCIDKSAFTAFDKAERYMEIYPDSALLLLNQIPHPERLHGKQQADYALLLTQARDKNYLDSLQSDSLIKIAVDYYRGSEDRVRAGKAFLYYGKVMALQGKGEMAMQAFLDAQNLLEKSKEYKLLALIQQYIGSLNDDRGMYDMALDNYRRSIGYSKIVGDTLKVVYSYRNIAWIYEVKQNPDSAIWYAKAGISLLKQDSLTPVFSSLSHFLGEQEKRNKKYSEAIAYFFTAIKYERIPNLIHSYYMSLGDTYLRLGQMDKAEKIFKDILISKDIRILSGSYNFLYLLEKRRADYAKALYYKEKSDSLQLIRQNIDLQSKILAIQKKHETDNLMMENKLLAQEKKINAYIWGSVYFLLLVLSVLTYWGIRKQYKKIYKKHLKVRMEKELKTYQRNELIIGEYIRQIEELKQKEILSVENTKEKIGKLNQKLQILMAENKEIRENSGVSAPYILGQLKKGLLLVENMTRQEKQSIFEYMDMLSGNFVANLRKSYNLNENNLMLAVLIKLSFSTSELVIAFDCEENSIYRKKQRLKEKLHLGKQDDLEAFFSVNPLYLSISGDVK